MAYLDEVHRTRREAVPKNLKLLNDLKAKAHCRENFIELCKASDLENFNNVYSEVFELLNIISRQQAVLETIYVHSARIVDKQKLDSILKI